MVEKNIEALILQTLAKEKEIPDSFDFSQTNSIEHTQFVGHLKSLVTDEYVLISQNEKKQWVLTSEGQDYLKNGTPEYRLFNLIPAEGGISKEQLTKDHEDLFKFGFQNGMKKKWFAVDKAFIKRGVN